MTRVERLRQQYENWGSTVITKPLHEANKDEIKDSGEDPGESGRGYDWKRQVGIDSGILFDWRRREWDHGDLELKKRKPPEIATHGNMPKK